MTYSFGSEAAAPQPAATEQPSTSQLAGEAAAAARAGSQSDFSLNQRQPQHVASNQTLSWEDELLDVPVTLATTTEAVAKLELALIERSKRQANPNVEVRVFGIDNTQESNWMYSSAIIAVHFKAENNVSYLPFLIEATAARELSEVSIRLGDSNQAVQALPVPSFAMDAVYQDRMEEEISRLFPGARALYVPGTLVPKTFDFNNSEAVNRLLVVGVRACVANMAEINPKFVDNNLGLFRSKGLALRLNVAGAAGATSEDPINVVGQPFRQTLLMKLISTSGVEQSQSQGGQIAQTHNLNGNGDTERPIGSLSAYVDYRLLPPSAAASLGMQVGYNHDPYAFTRRFVPELIITSVDLPQMPTTAGMFMMISQATVMGSRRIRDSVAYQTFRNASAMYKGAPFNPEDPGYLDLIADHTGSKSPAAFELDGASSTPQDFLNFMNAVSLPDIAISIDVPRLGILSPFMALLTSVARNELVALQFLQSSLDKLTNGLFTQVFFGNQVGPTGQRPQLTREHVLAEYNNTIYTGFFPQRIGDRNRDVDIRHITLNAVIARFGKQDPTYVHKWAQSFMVGQVDATVRMAQKREVINAYTNDSATITDMADRHTFNQKFLAAIVQCNITNKFEPVLQYTDPLAGNTGGMFAPGFMQGGLWSDAIAGSFSQNQQGQANVGGGYYTTTAGRF